MSVQPPAKEIAPNVSQGRGVQWGTMTNLMKRADRQAMRQARMAEVADVNQIMRWSKLDPAHARRMCVADLAYLDDVEARLKAGDSSLEGWER